MKKKVVLVTTVTNFTTGFCVFFVVVENLCEEVACFFVCVKRLHFCV